MYKVLFIETIAVFDNIVYIRYHTKSVDVCGNDSITNNQCENRVYNNVTERKRCTIVITLVSNHVTKLTAGPLYS